MASLSPCDQELREELEPEQQSEPKDQQLEQKQPSESPSIDHPKKKQKRANCHVDGCPNGAVELGVCVRHGAVRARKRCIHNGCTSIAVRGGVCIRHGANRQKYCSPEGGITQVQNSSVYLMHGAKPYQTERPPCQHEGCTNQAIRLGVCARHGAERLIRICGHDGCSNQVVEGGVCMRHGAKVKMCTHEGCTNIAQKGGVCIRHGAKRKMYTCSEDGCATIARRGGFCGRHYRLNLRRNQSSQSNARENEGGDKERSDKERSDEHVRNSSLASKPPPHLGGSSSQPTPKNINGMTHEQMIALIDLQRRTIAEKDGEIMQMNILYTQLVMEKDQQIAQLNGMMAHLRGVGTGSKEGGLDEPKSKEEAKTEFLEI